MQPFPGFESPFMVFYKSIPAVKIIFKKKKGKKGGDMGVEDSSGSKSRGKKATLAPFSHFLGAFTLFSASNL